MFTQVRKKKNDLERKIFWSLIGTIILLFVLYLFFVGSSVVHVVLREEVKKDTAEVHAQVAALEAQYLAQTEAIDEDFAYLLGYISLEQTEKHFAVRETTVVGLLE